MGLVACAGVCFVLALCMAFYRLGDCSYGFVLVLVWFTHSLSFTCARKAFMGPFSISVKL